MHFAWSVIDEFAPNRNETETC